jgi:hypothetical protein
VKTQDAAPGRYYGDRSLNQRPALDAAMTLCLHLARYWRGTSEAER